MTIKEIEEKTGIPRANIRYYEQEKLIQPKRRTENQYRDYSPEDLDALERIRFFRLLGFSVKDIRRMQQAPCLAPYLEARQRALEAQREELGELGRWCAALNGEQSFRSVELPSAKPEEAADRRRRQIQKEDERRMGMTALAGLGSSALWGIAACLALIRFGFTSDNGYSFAHTWADPWWLLLGSVFVFFFSLVVGASMTAGARPKGRRLLLALVVLLNVYGIAVTPTLVTFFYETGFLLLPRGEWRSF